MRHLRDFGRDEGGDVGEHDPHEIETIVFLCAPRFARHILQCFGDAVVRKADALVRAEAFVMHAVRWRARKDRFGVERGEVITFEIAIVGDLPVRAMDRAAAHVSPLAEIERVKIIKEAPEIGIDINRRVGG